MFITKLKAMHFKVGTHFVLGILHDSIFIHFHTILFTILTLAQVGKNFSLQIYAVVVAITPVAYSVVQYSITICIT